MTKPLDKHTIKAVQKLLIIHKEIFDEASKKFLDSANIVSNFINSFYWELEQELKERSNE